MDQVRMLTAGEQGLVVEFGSTIAPGINSRVHSLARSLTADRVAGITELVPTYRSLLVYFDPFTVTREELKNRIAGMLALAAAPEAARAKSRVIHIPVCYGGEFGPDLGFVAEHNRLTAEEVIDIHSSKPYLVYMLGFTPGFPYLGGMSERIAAPRLEKPRTAIPAGSVGIAGSQTGFYPVESPGGWQLIGRTPIKAFNPGSECPFMFAAGDYLKFEPISGDEYDSIRREVDAGNYSPEVGELDGENGVKQ